MTRRRSRRLWTVGSVLVVLGVSVVARGTQLVARVDPAWSPFVTAPAPEAAVGLVTEARRLLLENPARMAEVLAEASPPPSARILVLGLRADGRYQSGGDDLWAAQRLYRALDHASLDPAQKGWTAFMEGTIEKVLGFPEAAVDAFRVALQGPPGPWSAALVFDAAVLDLEAERFSAARDGFRRWLALYPDQSGRTLILYLLAEAETALGDAAGADHFAEALARDPSAWEVRPATGHALADLFARQGEPDRAVSVLDRIAEASPGTPEAATARLDAGALWASRGEVARAARSYAKLVDEGTTDEGSREALLRLALLGARHADEVELTEPYPAYRVFYRPAPTLETMVAEHRDALGGQRALRALSDLAWGRGDRGRSLSLLVDAFERYPESPESGRSFETFMDRLEIYLTRLLSEDDPEGVVDGFASFRRATRWVANRDVGVVTLRAAEAYDRLGATGMARELYEEMLRRGTRAADRRELERRILATQAREGDPEAVVERAKGGDWQARLAAARRQADEERGRAAVLAFARVEKAAPGAAEALVAATEGTRIALEDGTPASLLRALEHRRELWEKLSGGETRDGWVAEGHLLEARLAYAAGDPKRAMQAYAAVPEPSPADRFLAGLAEAKSGRSAAARARWTALAGGEDPVYGPMAAQQLTVLDLLEGKATP